MSISSIGSGAPAYADLGIGLSSEGRLALLVLEHEETQQDTDHASKALAREQYIAASDAEVAALRDEARDMRKSAFVQGALTLGSATIKVFDTLSEPECDPITHETPEEKPWGEIASGTCDGAVPTFGKYFESSVSSDRADGKHASQAAKLAEWDMGDASDAIKKSDERQDKATEWLNASNANQASTAAAIIAGFA
jgi:hypothetical protein